MYTSLKAGKPVWHDSPHVCALADDERHLGHIVNEGEWVAVDATHASESGQGMRRLGTFASADSAKAAVEQSVGIHHPPKAAYASATETSIH